MKDNLLHCENDYYLNVQSSKNLVEINYRFRHYHKYIINMSIKQSVDLASFHDAVLYKTMFFKVGLCIRKHTFKTNS